MFVNSVLRLLQRARRVVGLALLPFSFVATLQIAKQQRTRQLVSALVAAGSPFWYCLLEVDAQGVCRSPVEDCIKPECLFRTAHLGGIQ